MQGKLAGVQVSTSTGQPGGGVSVRIRGMGGLGEGDPLYVIDGVIINNSSEDSRIDYGTPTTNALASINPSDIESINVLKDASATAIYGSRGANGVVLITTKRGEKGEPKLNYNAYYGTQKVTKYIDLMDAQQFIEFSNEARNEAGLAPFLFWDKADTLGVGTDWQKELFRRAPMHNQQLSISGGGKKNNYYISFGYTNQDGIVLNSGFKRYSVRVNTDNQLRDWLKIGNSLTLTHSKTKSIASGDAHGIIASALKKSPTIPVYTNGPEGSQEYAGPFEYEAFYTGRMGNPVRAAKEPTKESSRNKILGSVYGEIDFFKGLKYKMNLGFDYNFTNNNSFNPTYVEYPVYPNQQVLLRNTTPSAAYSVNNRSNLSMDNILTYSNTFFDSHHLTLMAGYSAQKYDRINSYAESKSHRNNELNTVAAGRDHIGSQSSYGRSYVSILSRLTYNYKRKYYLSANFRRDGASMFGENNKYGNFPSLSAAWRVSGEKFMETFNWLSDMKVRYSWGRVGDDQLFTTGIPPQYAIMSDIFYVVFDDELVNGYAPASVPNKNLKWETAEQSSFGIDLSLFKNKLNLVVDYFIKNRYDIITEKRTPRYMGVVTHYYPPIPMSQMVNFAETIDKGYELQLGYKNYEGDIKWDISANFSALKNEVTKLDQDLSGGQTYIGDVTLTREGHSLNEFYGYVMDGIFTSQQQVDEHAEQVPGSNSAKATAPGDIRFKDINGKDEQGNIIPGPDGIIDEADRKFIGSPIPDFIYGLSGNFSYQGFDLNYQFQGVHGNEIFNVNFLPLLSSRDAKNKHIDMVNRWHPDNNPDGNQPRANANDPNDNARISDRYIEDGSYLKLKNLELGYSLPIILIKKVGLTKLRFYISAQNLLTFTNYRGYDPDVPASGIDNGIYPQARIFMMGINVGL